MNPLKLLFRLLLGRRLPITAGTVAVPGLEGDVLIRRDGYGIPYIRAERAKDALFGLGFCQGQDRTFQVELLARVTRGTLAELVGAEALPVDRLSRRIGFRKSAERQLPLLDEETSSLITAFARGVTAGSTQGCGRVPHEFTLLRSKPSGYDTTDVLGLIKLISFELACNWDVELARLKMLTEDGPEAVKALDPAYPEWQPVTSEPYGTSGPTLDRLGEDLDLFVSVVGPPPMSNNWAISGEKTATGSPILANDPHLPPMLPPHWYLAHMRCPEWGVAGASFVGAPIFAAGHNGYAAWGVTNGFVDNTDLFLEEIGPDGASVREGDRFVPCGVRSESIVVKGGQDVVEQVLETRRGPIIGPALEGGFQAVSLMATWLREEPLERLFEPYRAGSFREFRKAFAQWPCPPQNMVYADSSGTIGWFLVGKAPRRRKGRGTIPLPGWDQEVGWHEDPIPFDEMPWLENPEHGFVATANTLATRGGENPYLGVDCIDGYRLSRLVEALGSRNDWDGSSVRGLQMDEESMVWQELRETLLRVPPTTDEVRLALELMESRPGTVSLDSPAATVFEMFIAEMSRRVARAKAPRSSEWALGKSTNRIAPYSLFVVRRVGHLVRLLREQPQVWFDAPWPDVMADALTQVVRTLQSTFGPDPKGWAWGVCRPLTLRHPLGERKVLRGIFNLGPFPFGGDTNTVNQAAVPPQDALGNPLAIASLRAVIDVGDWDASLFSLPGGQCGNPLSAHYDDLLPFWVRGDGVPVAWCERAVENVTRSVLRLIPS